MTNEINMCQTCYPSRVNLSKPMTTSLTATNILTAGTNIIINAFLICGLVNTKQLRKLSSMFIIYLSISDLLVGLLLQLLVVSILLFYEKELNCHIELATQFIAFVFPQFSAVQIMIIAMNRCFRMKFLKQHHTYVTRKRGLILVIFNACLAIVLATTSVLASISQRFYFFNLVLAIIDLTVLLLIFVFYNLTYFSVHGYVRQAIKKDKERQTGLPNSTTASTTAVTRSVTTRSRLKTESVLTRTMLFILASLSVCYPVFDFGCDVSYFQYKDPTSNNKVLSILTWWSFVLVFLNSSINAMIFTSRNQKIMELLRRITRRDQPSDPTTATELSCVGVSQ